MGLDMYAARKVFVKNWSTVPAEKRYSVQITQGGKPVPGIQSERIASVDEEVMYWRKANHIHAWFVDNVQDGKDDCGEYFVAWEKLEDLLRVCEEVLRNSVLLEQKCSPECNVDHDCDIAKGERRKIIGDYSAAKALLPTRGGFFFGTTEYGEDYFSDVLETRDWIKAMLRDKRNGVPGYIHYRSSW